jgi:hypothetical protein
VPVGCVGCHTPTPDGNALGFTAQWPWPNAFAGVGGDSGVPTGAVPAWLAAGAAANLSPNYLSANYLGGSYITSTNNVDAVELGIETFSKAHFVTGDRIEVTTVGSSLDQPDNPGTSTPGPVQPACVGGTAPCVVSQLIWIDLEWNGAGTASNRPNAMPSALSNGGWGVIARTGDPNSAAAPSFSHDGQTIAYTSVFQGVKDGNLYLPTTGTADLYVVPYGAQAGPGGAGGTASPVAGASTTTANEYNPTYSPDDELIAFNTVPSGQIMYTNSLEEVDVVPASGGLATRLRANDPPACSGLTSPGIQNSWPRWAPAPANGVKPAGDGRTYYWMAFASNRLAFGPAAGKKQIFVAAVVVEASGAVTSYPAIYAWNQDPTMNNLMPAWDMINIPSGNGGPAR